MRTDINIVAGNSSTEISGKRNSRYRATSEAPTSFTAMNRQSSNSVKMLKIAARATKPTRKLSASVRNSVASNKLGNPERPTPSICACRVGFAVFAVVLLWRFPIDVKSDGFRLVRRKKAVSVIMKTVAIHAPTSGDTDPDLLWALLNSVRWLRTHYLGVIRRAH